MQFCFALTNLHEGISKFRNEIFPTFGFFNKFFENKNAVNKYYEQNLRF